MALAPTYSFSPNHKEDETRFKTGLIASVILHLIIAVFILVKGLFFPGEEHNYVPVLRVDVVGLPDILKKDLPAVPPPLPKAEENVIPPAKTETIPDEKEMSLDTKKLTKKEKKERKDKMKNALHRIEALEKIVHQEEVENRPSSLIIKGNKVSPGFALTGDAKEADAPHYADIVRERLRSNWELPVYLQRQNLSARVLINIDARGRIVGLKFIRASGDAKFDEAVKHAVLESDPLPAPPQELQSSVLSSGIIYGFPL